MKCVGLICGLKLIGGSAVGTLSSCITKNKLIEYCTMIVCES